MTNREIVDKYLNLIRTCVECQFSKYKKDKENMEDFYQDLVLILLEYDNEKMNDADINNHFNALVTKIIIQNIYSKTSPYYKAYKKFPERACFQITTEMKETIPYE